MRLLLALALLCSGCSACGAGPAGIFQGGSQVVGPQWVDAGRDWPPSRYPEWVLPDGGVETPP